MVLAIARLCWTGFGKLTFTAGRRHAYSVKKEMLSGDGTGSEWIGWEVRNPRGRLETAATLAVSYSLVGKSPKMEWRRGVSLDLKC